MAEPFMGGGESRLVPSVRQFVSLYLGRKRLVRTVLAAEARKYFFKAVLGGVF